MTEEDTADKMTDRPAPSTGHDKERSDAATETPDHSSSSASGATGSSPARDGDQAAPAPSGEPGPAGTGEKRPYSPPDPGSGPSPDRGGRQVEYRSFRRDDRGRGGPPGPDDRGRGGPPPGGYRGQGGGGAPRRYEGGYRRGGPPGRSGGGQRPSGPDRGRPGPGDRRDRGAPYQRPGPPPPMRRGPSPSELLAQGEEVVAGRRPVEEAFAARRAALRLLVVPERRDALDQLVLHATTLRIPVVEVEGGTITAVSGFDGHQGIALVVEPRVWATVDEVMAAARAAGEPPFILVLDHLEDPQNVGTLLRTAEATAIHGVIFPTRGSAPFSPAAIKASSGAIEHMRLVPTTDLAGTLVDLHARGVRIVGADEGASLTIREADLRGPVAIVVGSEGRGLQARVRKRVDLVARIPMRGRVASLNASVAGSVFLFEAAAQRADAPSPPPAETASGHGEPVAPDVEEIGSSPPDDSAAPESEVAEAAISNEPSEAPAVDLEDALLPEPGARTEPSDGPAGEGAG